MKRAFWAATAATLLLAGCGFGPKYPSFDTPAYRVEANTIVPDTGQQVATVIYRDGSKMRVETQAAGGGPTIIVFDQATNAAYLLQDAAPPSPVATTAAVTPAPAAPGVTPAVAPSLHPLRQHRSASLSVSPTQMRLSRWNLHGPRWARKARVHLEIAKPQASTAMSGSRSRIPPACSAMRASPTMESCCGSKKATGFCTRSRGLSAASKTPRCSVSPRATRWSIPPPWCKASAKAWAN